MFSYEMFITLILRDHLFPKKMYTFKMKIKVLSYNDKKKDSLSVNTDN